MKLTSTETHYVVFSSLPIFPPLRSKHSPQLPVLKHTQSKSSIRVTDEILIPHKIKGKVVVLCVLIFTFIEKRQKGKMLWTRILQHFNKNQGHWNGGMSAYTKQTEAIPESYLTALKLLVCLCECYIYIFIAGQWTDTTCFQFVLQTNALYSLGHT
jgi:hypothetical protein